MQPIDVIIIVAAIAAVIGVIAATIRNKKKGKSGCGCGCDCCPSKGACGGASANEKKDETKN